LATEEQGRKSLHGHFLIFIEGWKKILEILQRKKGYENQLPWCTTIAQTRAFHDSVATSQLFADFQPHQPLDSKPVFFHHGCRSKRKEEKMRFTVKPVPNQVLREMRQKKLCRKHNGKIANCEKCGKFFSNDEIIQNALNLSLKVHQGEKIVFPEKPSMHLDWWVDEVQKDFSWYDRSKEEKAVRYFASNVQTNAHFVTHANRCFKKKNECFANLPDEPSECTKFLYNEVSDEWADYLGLKEERFMFALQPKRNIEDCFANTHNALATTLLGCNNNVLFCMTGPIVMYVTGYNVKSQQKEEKAAFESVSRALSGALKNQVRVI
jgi:hypothetical protein